MFVRLCVDDDKGLVGTAPGGGPVLGLTGLVRAIVSRCYAVDPKQSKSNWKSNSYFRLGALGSQAEAPLGIWFPNSETLHGPVHACVQHHATVRDAQAWGKGICHSARNRAAATVFCLAVFPEIVLAVDRAIVNLGDLQESRWLET